MPTATSTLGWTLANLGSVPATFTLPASCTQSKYYIAPTDFPDFIEYANSCESLSEDCYPKPTDSALAEASRSSAYIVPYYSPGPACPADWKTVGAIAHPTDGAATSSGVFTIARGGYQKDPYAGTGYLFQKLDAFGALLDPGETAIACCPSSMTVGPSGVCFTQLPTQTVSTGCYYTGYDAWSIDVTTATVPLNGTTVTGWAMEIPTSLPDYNLGWTSTTTTLNASEVAQYTALTYLLPRYLVHQSTDLQSAATATETESADDTLTNAAAGYSYRRGESGGVSGVLGVLAVSVLAGMALVFPW